MEKITKDASLIILESISKHQGMATKDILLGDLNFNVIDLEKSLIDLKKKDLIEISESGDKITFKQKGNFKLKSFSEFYE